MKKFLTNLLLFFCFLILIGCFIGFSFIYKHKITLNDIPSLNFSDSYSFNQKLKFLHESPKDANVFALGSSMALNNLHSSTIIRNLPSNRFLNTGSWGMSIGEDFSLLKSLYKVYKIKAIIISSSIIDFKQEKKIIDFNFVESYLLHKKISLLASIYKHLDFDYYLQNLTYTQKLRKNTHDYQYLKYDAYGTVNYERKGFLIDEKRWENDYLDSVGKKNQYLYLDSICTFCKQNGIKLLFFQSPIREGIYTKLTPLKLQVLKFHTEKIKVILQKNNNLFVDADEKLWPDSLFVDAIHFSNEGAKLFTEFCFDRLKLQKKNLNYELLQVNHK